MVRHLCVPSWLGEASSSFSSSHWELCPDLDSVLRSEGADPAVLRERGALAVAIAEEALAEGLGLLRPAAVAHAFAVSEFHHQRLELGGAGYLAGPLVSTQLHRAQFVVVAICTVGPALEAAASKRLYEDPAMGVAIDAVGTAGVDLLATAVCERLGDEAEGHGLGATTPFSPGQVGWPLASGQAQLFGLVDASSIGVRLTEGYMMMPRKSSSLVVGIGEGLEHPGDPCDYCSMATTCRYRLRRSPQDA